MIQKETNLVVADNSGAKSVRAFTLYGGSYRKSSGVGDIVLCAVKDAIPNGKVKKGDIVRCVIVRCKKQTQRADGSTISFDDNAVVIINDEKSKIDVTADLKNASIDYSFLGFNKPLDEDGTIKTTLIFKNNKLSDVPNFHLKKNDFLLDGKISLNKNGEISTINIEKIEGPKTSANAKIEFTYQPKYKIKINDDERQLIVKALYDWRNELPKDSLLRPDLEQLILKIIDTPDASFWRRVLE